MGRSSGSRSVPASPPLRRRKSSSPGRPLTRERKPVPYFGKREACSESRDNRRSVGLRRHIRRRRFAQRRSHQAGRLRDAGNDHRGRATELERRLRKFRESHRASVRPWPRTAGAWRIRLHHRIPSNRPSLRRQRALRHHEVRSTRRTIGRLKSGRACDGKEFTGTRDMLRVHHTEFSHSQRDRAFTKALVLARGPRHRQRAPRHHRSP